MNTDIAIPILIGMFMLCVTTIVCTWITETKSPHCTNSDHCPYKE